MAFVFVAIPYYIYVVTNMKVEPTEWKNLECRAAMVWKTTLPR